MILIAIALIEAVVIVYLVMLHTGKIKDADKDFIADSVETKVEEIQVNAVNKLNRLLLVSKDLNMKVVSHLKLALIFVLISSSFSNFLSAVTNIYIP